MDRLKRAITTATQTAAAAGVNDAALLTQIVGEVAIKVAAGATDRDIYEVAQKRARELAIVQQRATIIDRLMEKIARADGTNPLLSAQAL